MLRYDDLMIRGGFRKQSLLEHIRFKWFEFKNRKIIAKIAKHDQGWENVWQLEREAGTAREVYYKAQEKYAEAYKAQRDKEESLRSAANA